MGCTEIGPVADGAKLSTESCMNLSGATVATNGQRNDVARPAESFSELHWYAAYTCANHEKRVVAEFQARSIEHFLPLYRSLRCWKDRRVNLELPLFPGYVFVRLALRDRLGVLQTPSVVRLVGFNGFPTALPDKEVEILRSGLCQGLRAEPHSFLVVGRRVRVTSGPFAGLEGVLKKKRGNLRVVVSFDMIYRSIAVEIDQENIEPLH